MAMKIDFPTGQLGDLSARRSRPNRPAAPNY
jgi:hypothetical protein